MIDWSEYLTTLANKMNLTDWEFTLVFNSHDCPDFAMASVFIPDGLHHVQLHLHRDWEKYSPEKQREGLVHELIHVYLNPMMVHTERAKPLLGTAAGDLFKAVMVDADEMATDGLTRIISPHMPLPTEEVPA